MTISNFGAVAFGIVIGWITYRTLVRSTKQAQVSDLATVIGAVGGGAVTTLFNDQHLFGLYAIGLFGGFFAYLIVFSILNGAKKTATVMGPDPDAAPVNFGGDNG